MRQDKKWSLKPVPPTEDVKALSEPLRISEPLAILLMQRGIGSFDAAKTFFTANLTTLHDPFLMKDMDKAVARLQQAIAAQERILVYGDYDVDGTTSVAMMCLFLRKLGANLDSYIPDRYAEGYGVSERSIDFAKEQGFSLIISLDCGIKSYSHVARAKTLGIDFIICDHHQSAPPLPPAVAVLDPKRADCLYPYKELTGCGVGFKLAQAVAQKQGMSYEELWPLLDLVATSTACDIVPITGENRVLVKYGLEQISANPRIGVQALINTAKLPKVLNVSNLVFGLGPRINAAGRIEHGKYAVEMLLCENEEQAAVLAQAVDDRNELRREYDSTMTEQALEMIVREGLEETKSTVLYHPEWHKGVIGIVASRCIEHYHKPTIILTLSNGKVSGSARSVRGFSIYDALCQCENLLEQFGGHDYAAGMTLLPENVEAFKARFEEVVSARITPEQLMPTIDIDAMLRFDQITSSFYKTLCRMEPFGPGNMSPMFASKGVYMAEPPRLLKEKHVKLVLKQEGSHAIFEALGFNMPELYQNLNSMSMRFSICYSIDQNEFNGQQTLQLMLKDVKL